MKLEISDIVALFDKHKPSDYYTVKKMGLKLKPIGRGAYRKVYAIHGVNLVVKFPNDYYVPEDATDSEKLATEIANIEHSLDEVRNIKKVLRNKKYKAFHRYMPKIYYHNKDGIVLMERYRPIKKFNKTWQIVCDVLSNLLNDIGLENNWCHDIHWGNIGLTQFDEIKLFDVGILD